LQELEKLREEDNNQEGDQAKEKEDKDSDKKEGDGVAK